MSIKPNRTGRFMYFAPRAAMQSHQHDAAAYDDDTLFGVASRTLKVHVVSSTVPHDKTGGTFCVLPQDGGDNKFDIAARSCVAYGWPLAKGDVNTITTPVGEPSYDSGYGVIFQITGAAVADSNNQPFSLIPFIGCLNLDVVTPFGATISNSPVMSCTQWQVLPHETGPGGSPARVSSSIDLSLCGVHSLGSSLPSGGTTSPYVAGWILQNGGNSALEMYSFKFSFSFEKWIENQIIFEPAE